MTSRYLNTFPRATHRVALCGMALLMTTILLWLYSPNAYAGSVSLDTSKTTATIAPSTSIEYDASKAKEALWNHGCFYVYFFQGASSTSHSAAKASNSSIATRKYSIAFKKGFSWAKVHVAAVDSCSKGNGGKNKRLKNSSGNNIGFGSYLTKSRRFYVWISDTGGTQGSISLRGTTKRTVYANATTYKNVNTITVASQLGADPDTQGTTESSAHDVINIPFNWSGKLVHQVPYKEIRDSGVGSSGKNTFYRLSWWQYSDGVVDDGYSPYKLQHNSSSASNMWASVNLGAVGISTVPTYKDAKCKTRTSKVYRNYNTTLGISLKSPREQILINTNGGTLAKGSNTYSGTSEPYTTKGCESKVSLPTEGRKVGKDKTSNGYVLTGYTWTAGTNRKTHSSTTPSTSKKFVPFDQSSPQTIAVSSPSVTLCNSWQMLSFDKKNSSRTESMLPAVENATVTFKANWKPKTFAIHYEVDGIETKTVSKDYDSAYTIESAPKGSSGWAITKQDGSSADSKGYMPSQDIYVRTSTLSPATIRYIVNGEVLATYSVPFGTSPLVSQVQKSTWNANSCQLNVQYLEKGQQKTYRNQYPSPNNSFGGTLSSWHTDSDCTNAASELVNIKPGETLNFYAFTTHTVHFWLDACTQKEGTLEPAEEEKRFCLHEQTCRYGESFEIPSAISISKSVTRAGCEDWAETCGAWFEDRSCSIQAAPRRTCTGDLILHSYSTVKLSYDLADSAKELDALEGGSYSLYKDQSCTLPLGMRSFLPSSTLLRYGDSVKVSGDGTLYRKAGADSVRTLSSVEGGFLNRDGQGDLLETITLKQSMTLFKDWSQSIFDGIVTS